MFLRQTIPMVLARTTVAPNCLATGYHVLSPSGWKFLELWTEYFQHR
jgi:hypothetical protein